MICSQCGAKYDDNRFECSKCGNELTSKSGVKAMVIIFWCLMVIWALMALQIEVYFHGEDFKATANVLWSLRCNELTSLLIIWGLSKYWQGKQFFPVLLIAFIFYLLTLWWICNAFSIDAEDSFSQFYEDAHVMLRAIFAYIAIAFAWYVNRLKFSDSECVTIGKTCLRLPNAGREATPKG